MKRTVKEQTILLNENSVDFRIFEKSVITQFRAPLSGYFEAEIHVPENDYEKADKLLSKWESENEE